MRMSFDGGILEEKEHLCNISRTRVDVTLEALAVPVAARTRTRLRQEVLVLAD
jgi:hypothetical protein